MPCGARLRVSPGLILLFIAMDPALGSLHFVEIGRSYLHQVCGGVKNSS